MVKIRQVDVALLDKPKSASPSARELTPRARERLAQQKQFERMLTRIGDRDTVFEIRLEGDEKALTVRQRLMKAAQVTGREVVVRKSDKGWLVGMSSPDRKS
jgi:hypothetical protein